MNGSYLLDTNIVIAAFNGDPFISSRIRSGPEAFLSVITVGELLRGAFGSRRVEANVQRVRALAITIAVLACETATAEKYALISQGLRTKGRPMLVNDIWIAATALQHQLTLVTRDQHFVEVDGLAIEAW